MARFFFTQEQNMEMIVKDGKPMGGAVVATHVWITALNELGHEVLLACFENDNRPVLNQYSWIKTISIYNPKKGLPVIRWVLYRFPKYYSVLKKNNIDFLVDSIPSWGTFFMGILCRKLKIKQIARVANDNMLDERIKLTHTFFERFFISQAFKFCPIIMVQNDFQFNSLRKKYPNKQILKISNPFIISKENLSIKTSMKGYIAWVANFRYQKNLKLLFEIAEVLNEEDFKIAGIPMASMDSETTGYLEKLKGLPNVEFVGQVSRKDILQFYSKAKFLLNTSRYEGFSNTFLEALTCGVPILTTNNVNPDEIVSKFNLGVLYINERDLEGVLDTIDEKKYQIMSKNAVDYVQKNHDHIVLGRKLIDFLSC
jgi:glycosyltransferase involved in cell wall biosynthesis